MASPLQNRIVGSVILIALAVIILPELLDGKPRQQQEQFEAMPLQPDVAVEAAAVARIPTSEDFSSGPELAEPVELTAENAPNISTNDEATPSLAKAPTKASLAEPGWVIQLGVFSNQESVDRLINQLQQAGFPAYREATQSNGRALTKLLVGPSLVKSELEQQLPQLKKLTQLNGTIIRFEP